MPWVHNSLNQFKSCTYWLYYRRCHYYSRQNTRYFQEQQSENWKRRCRCDMISSTQSVNNYKEYSYIRFNVSKWVAACRSLRAEDGQPVILICGPHTKGWRLITGWPSTSTSGSWISNCKSMHNSCSFPGFYCGIVPVISSNIGTPGVWNHIGSQGGLRVTAIKIRRSQNPLSTEISLKEYTYLFFSFWTELYALFA